MTTDKEIQEWFDSGPITPEMLKLWLQLINKGESNGYNASRYNDKQNKTSS